MPVTISMCKIARIRTPPSTRRRFAAPLPRKTTEVDGGLLRPTAAFLRPTAAISNRTSDDTTSCATQRAAPGREEQETQPRRPACRTRTLAPGLDARAKISPNPFRPTWILRPRPPGIAPRCRFRVAAAALPSVATRSAPRSPDRRSRQAPAHRWLANAEADHGRAILRRRAVAHHLGAGAAVAKAVDARGPRRGRMRPTRQGRCSGGWRRTRPQTEPAESEERDPPTGPARHRLPACGTSAPERREQPEPRVDGRAMAEVPHVV